MIKMHLSLRVADLGRAVAFYEAFFGVAPHKMRRGYANFDLATPPLKFALTQAAVQTEQGSLDHLGFQVASADELASIKARLQQAGLATFDETDTTCCYARQDKIWAHDPDGNEWEIYVLTDDLADDYSHDHAGHLLAQHESTAAPPIQPAHRCCS